MIVLRVAPTISDARNYRSEVSSAEQTRFGFRDLFDDKPVHIRDRYAKTFVESDLISERTKCVIAIPFRAHRTLAAFSTGIRQKNKRINKNPRRALFVLPTRRSAINEPATRVCEPQTIVSHYVDGPYTHFGRY